MVVIEVLTACPSFAINLVKSMTSLFPSSISEMGRKKRRKKKASS